MPAGATKHYAKWANDMDESQLWLQHFREITVLMPTWFFAREIFDRVCGFVEADPTAEGEAEDLIFFHAHISLELRRRIAASPPRSPLPFLPPSPQHQNTQMFTHATPRPPAGPSFTTAQVFPLPLLLPLPLPLPLSLPHPLPRATATTHSAEPDTHTDSPAPTTLQTEPASALPTSASASASPPINDEQPQMVRYISAKIDMCIYMVCIFMYIPVYMCIHVDAMYVYKSFPFHQRRTAANDEFENKMCIYTRKSVCVYVRVCVFMHLPIYMLTCMYIYKYLLTPRCCFQHYRHCHYKR